ncbi:MAG: TlpA disulfide reductase family protein [Bacteroidota bacterium]
MREYFVHFIWFSLLFLAQQATAQNPQYQFGDSTTVELTCANCSGYAEFNLRFQTTIPGGMQKVKMEKVEKGVFRRNIQVNQPQFGLVRMGIGLTIPFYVLPGETLSIDLDINNFDVIQKIDYQGSTQAICDYFYERQVQFEYPETSAKLYQLRYVSYKDSLLEEEVKFLDNYATSHPELPEWFVETERSEKKYYRIWDIDPEIFYSEASKFSRQYFSYLVLAFRDEIAPEIIQLADPEVRARAILKTYLNRADEHLKGEVREIFKTLTLTTWLPKVHNYAFADSIIRAHEPTFTNTKYRDYLLKFRDEVILKSLTLPEYEFVRYEEENTQPFTFEELRGKIVYVNFWFVGCRPCLTVLPYKKKFAESINPDEVVMVNICLYGTEENWRKDVVEHKVPGINVFAPNNIEREVLNEFGVTGFPHYVLADENGLIYIDNAPGPAAIPDKIAELQQIAPPAKKSQVENNR